MISLSIHEVKAIKASKITQQSGGGYVRDITIRYTTIRSNDDKIQLTLFAENKKDLNVGHGEWNE